jgi:hypothetical protein
VNVEDELEVLRVHLREALVTQHAGIVDEDVDAPEGVDRLLDEAGYADVVGDRGAVGNGFAAKGLDFLDDLLGSFGRAARAVDAAAEVVDHDLGAAAGEFEGVAAAEATACTGHDGDFSVKIEWTCEILCVLRKRIRRGFCRYSGAESTLAVAAPRARHSMTYSARGRMMPAGGALFKRMGKPALSVRATAKSMRAVPAGKGAGAFERHEGEVDVGLDARQFPYRALDGGGGRVQGESARAARTREDRRRCKQNARSRGRSRRLPAFRPPRDTRPAAWRPARGSLGRARSRRHGGGR